MFSHRFRRVIRYYKNRIIILTWFFPELWRFIFPYKKSRNRLLIVYDLRTQPFSIGDLLTFQEASLVLRKKNKCEYIDFALIGEASEIIKSTSTAKKINKNNYFYHLAGILPVIQVNPYLGSLFAFTSVEELEEYILPRLHKTHVWPSKWKISITREYLYYDIFENLLYPFYDKYKFLPNLQSRLPLQQWAKLFFKSNLDREIPITVNLRNNPHYQTERNANISVWIDFFKWCEYRYPVRFFIICSHSEIDDRFRLIKNVLIVKDFNTNIENDLALVEEASFHMGVASGPAAMAFFGNKPYAIFCAEFQKQFFSNKKIINYIDSRIQKLFFSNDKQFFISGNENLDDLIYYFTLLWSSLNINDEILIHSSFEGSDKQLVSWLR
jgi:hypothetical protein